MTHERDFYIEECKSVSHKYLQENQLIVNYIRDRKMKAKQHIDFKEGQANAIKTFLNVTGGVMTIPQSIRILNMILPEDQKLAMGTKEEKTKSIRAFESIWLHWNAKRSPVRGVAVAFTIVENGKSVKKAGWSLCNDEDKFNRFIGIRKAINYAQNINGLNYDAIPYRAFETVQCVIERANYEKSF